MAIPVYERGANIAPIPDAKVRNAGGPDAYGAGVWRAVEGFAGALEAKAEEFEDARTQEAFNSFQREVNAYHLDPDKGIYSTKRGKDADGVADAADRYMDGLIGQYMGKMKLAKSPRMARNFARMAAGVRERQYEANTRFQTAQIEAYRDAEADAGIQTGLDAVGREYADDDAVEALRAQMTQALELKTRGLGDEARRAALQELDDRIGAARLARMIDDDPLAARDWFEANREGFSSAAQLRMKDAVEKEAGGKIVRAAVDGIWGRYGDDEASARDAIFASDLEDEQKDAVWSRYKGRLSDEERFRAKAEADWYTSWYDALGQAESLEDAYAMIEQAGASGEHKVNLNAMARRTFAERMERGEAEESADAYIAAWRGVEDGTIRDEGELIKKYGPYLKESTMKTLRKQLIEGLNRDREDFEKGGGYIDTIMKEARIKKPEEQARFLAAYSEECAERQEDKGRRLSLYEKIKAARDLVRDVFTGARGRRRAAGKPAAVNAAEEGGFDWAGQPDLIGDFGMDMDVDVAAVEKHVVDWRASRRLPALEKVKLDFLLKITPMVVRESRKSGVLPSVTAAQAILESGWGTRYHPEGNAIFGIKADAAWKGDTIESTTTEYENGKKVVKRDRFRKYDTLEDAVRDRSDFLNKNKRYREALAAKNYRDTAQALEDAGYATLVDEDTKKPIYAKLLIGVIESNGLDILDRMEAGREFREKVRRQRGRFDMAGYRPAPEGEAIPAHWREFSRRRKK